MAWVQFMAHVWVEFVFGSRPCSEGFCSGSPVFLPKQNTTDSKFKFELETVDQEPSHECTTAESNLFYLALKSLRCRNVFPGSPPSTKPADFMFQ